MRAIKSITICICLLAGLLTGCKLTGPDGPGGGRHYIYNIGEIDTPGFAYASSFVSGRAYVADGAGGLRIIDAVVPHFPEELESYEGEMVVFDVIVQGDYAYLACGADGLKIIDVRNPFGPEEVGSFQTENAYALEKAGDYIYIADGAGGVRILDVSSVYAITELSRTQISGQTAYSVKLVWHHLYVGSRHGLSILNVENPFAPYELSFLQLDYVYDVDIVSDKMFVAYYGGMRIYDVSDKGQPVLLSEQIMSPARSLRVQGEYAYVGLGKSGLSVVSVANPLLPYEVAWYRPFDCEMNHILLAGRYLYIANGGRGLLILEFSPGN